MNDEIDIEYTVILPQKRGDMMNDQEKREQDALVREYEA
jgi:hypothetical protein